MDNKQFFEKTKGANEMQKKLMAVIVVAVILTAVVLSYLLFPKVTKEQYGFTPESNEVTVDFMIDPPLAFGDQNRSVKVRVHNGGPFAISSVVVLATGTATAFHFTDADACCHLPVQIAPGTSAIIDSWLVDLAAAPSTLKLGEESPQAVGYDVHWQWCQGNAPIGDAYRTGNIGTLNVRYVEPPKAAPRSPTLDRVEMALLFDRYNGQSLHSAFFAEREKYGADQGRLLEMLFAADADHDGQFEPSDQPADPLP